MFGFSFFSSSDPQSWKLVSLDFFFFFKLPLSLAKNGSPKHYKLKTSDPQVPQHFWNLVCPPLPSFLKKIHKGNSCFAFPYHIREGIKLGGGWKGWSGALKVCSELCATEDLATASFPTTGKLPVPNNRAEASENIVQQVKSEAQHHSQITSFLLVMFQSVLSGWKITGLLVCKAFRFIGGLSLKEGYQALISVKSATTILLGGNFL